MGQISTNRSGLPTIAEFNFVGMNNKVDPSRLDIAKGECTAIINMLPDARGRVYTRPGYTIKDQATYLGSWGTGNIAYVIKDSAIYSFNGTNLVYVTSITPNADFDFCEVNDIVVFSNGTDYKLLKGNAELTPQLPIAMPEFKVAPVAGISLEFYKGRLYIAKDNILYCTDPFTVECMDERFCIVDIYDAPITMVRKVDDGLYVSTEEEVYYLDGDDPFVGEGFTKRILLGYGIIKGTAIRTNGDAFPFSNLSGSIVIAASTRGIIIFGNGSAYDNISFESVTYGYGDRGVGLYYENNGSSFYLMSLPQNYSIENQYTIPVFQVDQQEV